MSSREEEIIKIRQRACREPIRSCRTRGSGTIEKRKDRKGTYRVKIPYDTYTDKQGRRQTRYKTIGTFTTKKQAEEALLKYNIKPYDVGGRIKTFADLYAAWSEEYFRTLSGSSSVRSITSVYAYLEEYYDMPIAAVSVGVIKDMMSKAYVKVRGDDGIPVKKYASRNTQERIKSLCNMMFDFAVEHNLVPDNPARKFKVTKLINEIDREKKKKKVFSPQDIENMWKHVDDIENMDMVLIQIYTGFRPQELCTLKIENIFPEEGYVIGGMKTDAGRNRVVPIHPKIMELVNNRYMDAVRNNVPGYLFYRRIKGKIAPVNYDGYRRIFCRIMEQLELKDFSPHCARHTFATYAETSCLRDLAIKQIMGHSYAEDVTDKYYKHTNIDYLKTEILKLEFGGGTDGRQNA